MATISLTLPSDGQTIDASDVNNPFNTIAAEINGNLDNSNIKAGAAIDRSKIAGFTDGWESLGYAPTTITALGNRSYTVLVPSVDTTTATSPGQRLKLPRTVTAPTQCADLEGGSSQYFVKTSPAGMIFTDDFTVSAWIKLESYMPTRQAIASRYNGTSGWVFDITGDGILRLLGYNASASNVSYVQSYQSVPLNKWVHVAAQLDMSTFTATTTTSYVMIDGVSVPASVARAGTNPTALVQAGDLEIGSLDSGSYFDGKIAQVAIYSAKVTQATILASMNQTLTGSETSLISAYTLNNSVNDLSANANNLTAQGSAVATNADTPFTNAVTGTSVTAGTTNYGIIMAQTFSTNTTYTIQIPEGETLPTTGGIGTVSYSTQKTPYGFPPMTNVISRIIVGTNSAVGDYLGMTTTFTANADATYRITVVAHCTNTSALTNNVLSVIDGSTAIHSQIFGALNTVNAWSIPTVIHDAKLSAGSHTIKLTSTATGGGTLVMYASGTSNIWATYTVEQLGLV